MGLSSWIQKLLDRTRSAKTARSACDEFVHLYLNRLEDRRVLNAAFGLDGTTLQLNNFTEANPGGQSLTIQQSGNDYQLILGDGDWQMDPGSDPLPVGISGEGTDTLTVAANLLADDTIQSLNIIDDSAGVGIDFDVNFATNTDFATPMLENFSINGVGAIEQSGGTSVQIPNLMVSMTDSLGLDETGNDFGMVDIEVSTSANLGDANGLILEDMTIGTSLSLNLAAGQSTQAVGTTISGGMSLTTLGAGTLILSQANTYTGGTVLDAGTLLVNNTTGSGTGTGDVAVNDGATLGGTGTVTGAVSINTGGTLSPGMSPGILATGNLNFADDSTFLAELDDDNATGTIAGTDYDQVQVTGSVTIGTNVALTLPNPDSTEVNAGDAYMIINNDGNDDVVGRFANLNQGDTLTINGMTARINYFGGDGNDVVLEVEGPFNYTNTGGAVTVRQNTTNGTIEIVKGGVVVDSRLATGVTEIIITGDDAQSDILTVDYGSGSFFTQTVRFDGGEDVGSDELIITGSSFGRVEHTFTGSESGDIVYDVDGNTLTPDDQATISYMNLEPVNMTGSTIGNLVFNLPGNNDMAILEDDTLMVGGVSQIRSQTGAFETTTFANPTVSLTINLGDDDASFTVASTPDLQTTLNINGQVGANDSVTFTGNLNLGPVGSLNVNVDAITMNDGTLVQTNAGTISLTATGNVQLSRLVTNNSTVTINTGGAITDNTLAEGVGNENIVANTIILNAGTGIGSAMNPVDHVFDRPEDIDIDGGNLSATNTTSGAIQIFESNSIALNTVSNTGTDGTVVLDAGAAITDNTAGDLVADRNIIATTTRLRAVSGIGTSVTLAFGDGEDIDISGGTLYAENTGTGSIQIFSFGNVALDQIIDNAQAGQTVLIESAGNITDASLADGTLANVLAANAGLKAVSGIGAAGLDDIDTTVDVLTAITQDGGIFIEDTNSLEIGDVGNNANTGVQITSAGTGDISVLANGTLTVTDPVLHAGTGNIALNAVGGDLNINANVITNFPGSITLSAGQNVTLNSTLAATPTVQVSGLGMSAFNSTMARNGIVDATGIISIFAGDTTSLRGNTSLIQNVGRVIQITTNDLVIEGLSQITTGATDPNANNGAVMIRNTTADQTIQLGGAGAGLNIDNAELQRIRTNALRIGRLDNMANAGDIQFTGDFIADPAEITTIQLFTGGSVTQTAGIFSADEISIFAGVLGQLGAVVNGNVELGNANNNAIRRLSVSAGGSIQFRDNNGNLTVDDVDDLIDDAGEGGNHGVISANSFVDLQAMAGNLVITNTEAAADISAGMMTNPVNNLAINLVAAPVDASIDINADAVVSATMGAHRYTADDMDIQGAITAGNNLVVLRNATNGIAIDLGDANATDDAGVLELTNTELGNINTNLLVIGSNNAVTTGTITFTDAIAPANTSTVHLISTGMITDTGAGAIVETNLIIEAGSAVVLDNIANDVVNLSALMTGGATSDLTFRDANQLNVESINGLTITNLVNDTVGTAVFDGIDTQGGDVLLQANTGITVTANDPINTSGGAGGGMITINVLMAGDILIEAPLITTGTTTGGNITLSTVDGNITTTTNGTLTATGTGVFAGGAITLTAGNTTSADSDVTLGAAVTTNNGGNIQITADDAVTLNSSLATTGSGTVTITANADVTNASTDGGNGSITMGAASMISTAAGMVTLRTQDDDLDEASIVVEQITTTSGSVEINANGINADVELRDVISIGNTGGVTVEADDSVTFLASASINAAGAGAVLVRANADNTDAATTNEILMNDGSVINAGTGLITLQTTGNGGGNITIGRLVTDNATNAAVTILSQIAVLDGGDTGGVDIEATANADARINIVAMTGVGTGNALETSGRRFDVMNTGIGPINIANSVDSLDVVIDRLSTTDQGITFTNTDINPMTPAGTLTIANTTMTGVVSTNISGPGNDENDILITTDGELIVSAQLNTNGTPGDGEFTLIGGATFTGDAAIILGTGDITLQSGGVDILINSDLTIDGGAANFYAPRDILISARLLSRVDNGMGTFVNATLVAAPVIDADIRLHADQGDPMDPLSGDGVGGVLVQGMGQVVASGNLLIEGSDLFNDALLAVPLPGAPGDIRNGVQIERDLGGQVQLVAAGSTVDMSVPALRLLNRPANVPGNDGTETIVLGGMIGTRNPSNNTNASILIDANGNILLADDVTIFTPAGLANATIVFGNADPMERDGVIDDGSAATSSNLRLNNSGTVVFYDRVGDTPADPDGLPTFTATAITERIDSLITDAGGQTHLRGGFVSTHGQQFYGDDVFLHADTNLVNSTSFTTTNTALNPQPGNVTFSGIVRGLDVAPGTEGTAILDDMTLNVAGTTTFNGFVGADPLDPTVDGTQRIGDGSVDGNGTGHAITINSSGETIFNSTVFTESGIRQIDGAGRVTFNANVFLDSGNRDSNAVADNNYDSLFLSNVTLNTVAIYSNGNLTFGSGNPNTDELLIAGTLDGGSVLDTTGRNFADANRLASEAGTPNVPSRNITINSRVTDPVQMALIPNQDLTLNLNTGDLLITGSVGNQAANNRFGNLIVQSANDFLFGPTRTVNIFSESLQQLTGVADGAERAVTQLSSGVDVSQAQGITIATQDVIYDSAMVTNGQRALTEADGSIFYTILSSLTTSGGMVVSSAVTENTMMGEINMGESGGFTATIDAGGGLVVLHAGSHVRVSQIRSAGGAVALTSLNGEVIDQGDQTGLMGSIGTHDIQAAQLRIDAENGIGTTGPSLGMETLISNLEAVNQTNGILITNTGDLTIGGLPDRSVATLRKNLDQPQVVTVINLPTLDGVSTVTGDIGIVTTGSMTVTEDIQNMGSGSPGNITLLALTGNFTVNQTIESGMVDGDTPNVTNIQADNGTVNVIAGVNIAMSGRNRTSANSGNVILNAGSNFMANDFTTIAAMNGAIGINAGMNFTSNNNTALSATNGNVGIETGANFTANDQSNFAANNGNLIILVDGNFSAGIENGPGRQPGQTVMTSSVGNIFLETGGTVMFGGHMAASNNGSILVDSTGNFTLQGNALSGAMDHEMVVEGTGEIIVTSDATIIYDVNSGAVVRSGTGLIRAVDRDPSVALIRNFVTPQVNTVGEAFLTFTLGFPDETNFTVIVDWGDSTVERVVRDAGTYTLRHVYAGPPNPSNPGSPIQIVVVAVTDPNIHFFGNNNAVNFDGDAGNVPLQQGPTLPRRSDPDQFGNLLEPNVNFPMLLNDPDQSRVVPGSTANSDLLGFIQQALNPTNRFTGENFPDPIDNLDVVTAFPMFPVPVSGFGGAAIIEIQERPPFFIPGASVTPLPENIDSGEDDRDDLDFAGSDTEEQAEEEIVVKLRVLSPSGQMLYEYVIPQVYLADPTLLWQKLPDGRYQIVIEEQGRSIPIVVRDVELKDHQVIRRFDRARRNETNEDSSQVEPQTDAQLSSHFSEILDGTTEPVHEPASPDQVWENWQRLPAARRRMPAPPKEDSSDKAESPAVAAALTGGLALGTLSRRSSDEADSQMIRFTKRALSPAARLRRRLRK